MLTQFDLSQYTLTEEQFRKLATDYFGTVSMLNSTTAAVRFTTDPLVDMSATRIKHAFTVALESFARTPLQ